MATVSDSDAAGAADWLSVLPRDWPPPVHGPPVLMVAIRQLSRNTASGYLAQVQPGTAFWASAADAPNLLASSQAVISPPGSSARPEPPLTVNGTPGIGAGTSERQPLARQLAPALFPGG